MVEISEMGTTSTGSAAVKKPVVAQVYMCTWQKGAQPVLLNGFDITMRGRMLTVTKMGWIVVR